MGAQFTPGPWSVANGCDQYVAAEGKWVASTMGVRGEEGAANARLMANAPEMLSALYQYVDDLRYPPTGDSIQRRIERAEGLIAKVLGEA